MSEAGRSAGAAPHYLVITLRMDGSKGVFLFTSVQKKSRKIQALSEFSDLATNV